MCSMNLAASKPLYLFKYYLHVIYMYLYMAVCPQLTWYKRFWGLQQWEQGIGAVGWPGTDYYLLFKCLLRSLYK